MSERNWHHVIAYLGIGAAFGFAVAAAFLPVEYEPITYAQQSESGGPAKSAEQWATETCAEAAKTTEPDNTEKQLRDLCAQFSAAASSERSAVFAEEQYRIGWVGLAGLAATVIVAVMAWLAASRSAKADNDALEIARDQIREAREASDIQLSKLERQIEAQYDVARAGMRTANATREIGQAQVRAYGNIEVVTLMMRKTDLVLQAKISNSGQSPVRNLICSHGSAQFLFLRPDADEMLSFSLGDGIQFTAADVPAGKDGLAEFHFQLHPLLRERVAERMRRFKFRVAAGMLLSWEDVFHEPFQETARGQLNCVAGAMTITLDRIRGGKAFVVADALQRTRWNDAGAVLPPELPAEPAEPETGGERI